VSDEELPGLFARAIELDSSGRAVLLEEVARRDADLAGELARLLAGAQTPSPLLDRPALASAVAAEDAGVPLERIGPYRILGELGRGGMGRVYRAVEETADFRRSVALKVIDRPAPDALRRFRDEVRILSSLEHPGIARFIAGGQAPDGTWFLALEQVEGEDLIRHAQRHTLPVARRIELFLAVLEAVEFAHRSGIVHRDLKPGHLLVGRDGRPRLLDFGISKLLDPETRESLSITRTEARALTPAYASPEQFRGEAVTPASDIYSLGVILYELLAGRRPFVDAGESRAALERAVLGTDPEPPSQAARRHPDSGALPPLRPGGRGRGRDLDAICLKALRKEPGERYSSVAELAEDLRRFLAGRPVVARRGGRRYRFGRYVGRHRAALAVAGALLVAAAALAFAARRGTTLPSAATGSPPSAVRPSTGLETVAELERRFAEAPSSLEAGAALAAALLRDERFKEAAVVIARARQLPGAAEDPLLDKVEGMIANRLDESQRALALFRRALANAPSRGRSDLVPSLLAGLSRTLSDLGQTDEAHAALLQGREEAERLGDRSTLALALNDLAVGELMRGNLAAGEKLLQQALVPARSQADPSHLGFVLDNLSGIAIERGRPDLAEARYREAIGVWRKAGRKQRAAIATGNLAAALDDLGRSDEAAAAREAAISDLHALDDTSSGAVVLASRASAAIEAGDLAAAERDAEKIDAAALASGSRESLAYAEELRGRIAGLRGESAAARRNLQQAENLHVADGDLDLAAEVAIRRANAEFREGAADSAERILAEGLARLDGAGEGTTMLLAEALRARIALSGGRVAEAQSILDRLGEVHAESPSLTRRLAYLAVRGTLAARLGRLEAARLDFRAAISSAEAGGRLLSALELRLDQADIEWRARSGRASELARAIRSEATHRGLVQLASRARALMTAPSATLQ
jgi:tetratricopeptide (TPR) repeat protein